MNQGDKNISDGRIMGWEVAGISERMRPRIAERLKPDGVEVRAAFVTMGVFLAMFILASKLTSGGGATLVSGIHLDLTVVGLAILFEFLDAAAGMGYGTAITPLLLLMGYEPIQIVPAIMVQQATAGLSGAYLHREFGNVSWKISPMSETMRLWLIISAGGCLAVIFSITSVYAILKLAKGWISIYVTALLVMMALVSLFQARKSMPYRPKRMAFFGILAGFNKGIGGGGYGPVVTLGGLISGVPVKTMMAITALSEGTVCVVSIIVWLCVQQTGVHLDFQILPSMLLGSAFAAIAAPYAVKVFHSGFWKWFVPIYSCFLALYSVIKIAGLL